MSSSKTARAASALKSGVVMGGTAILSAVNGLTPHVAGAIDIMVVQQPDGSFKCSPFYVRFGKYAPMRSKDKKVHILVNGEEAAFSMHLGAYGQAYFAAETMEVVSDADDEQLLQGMMSPPSGYSSDDGEGAPYANEEMLSAVQAEVQRMRDMVTGMPGAAAAVSASGSGDSQASNVAAAAAAAQQLDGGDSGLESSSSSCGTSNSASDEGLLSADEVARAIQRGLAASAQHPMPEGGDHGTGAMSGGGNDAAGSRSRRSRRTGRRTRRRAGSLVLQTDGDGAAEHPARAALQNMLLDNQYSIRIRSNDSFTADSLEAAANAARQALAAGDQSAQDEQLVQQQDPDATTTADAAAEPGKQQQQKLPVRHVGFQLPAEPLESAASCSHGGVGSTAGQLGDGDDGMRDGTGVPQPPDAGQDLLQGGAMAGALATLAPNCGSDGEGSISNSNISSRLQQHQQQQLASLESLSPCRSSRDGLLTCSLRGADQSPEQAGQQQPQMGEPSQLQPSTPTKAGAALSPALDEADDPGAPPLPSCCSPDTAATTTGRPPQPLLPSRPVAVPRGGGGGSNSGGVAATSATSPPASHAVADTTGGSLADSEGGGALGTSLDCGGTPPRSGSALGRSVDSCNAGGTSAAALALGLQGVSLSLCCSMLRCGMTPAEAQQVFETQRVNAQTWAERGSALMSDPELVVRVGGCLHSWQAAAPMLLGMLAFGGRWEQLLPQEVSDALPMRLVSEEVAAAGAKKSAVSASWRLWPFSSWRDASASNIQGKATVPNSSPSSSAAVGLGAPLMPSGGSFSNLLSLVAPAAASISSRSAPGTALRGGGADADGSPSGQDTSAVPVAGDSFTSMNSTATSLQRVSRKKHIIIIRKTLTPTSDQLARLHLKPGSNTITFRAGGAADLTAYVYLLRWDTRLVVSDVDGTITRSDLLGHVLPTLGVDWSHPGITQLFHNINANGYQIMFLSSRAIAQANITREYLHRLVQDGYKMPSGPVIISPHGLLPSLYREIVVRRPHEFKIACLQDIRALFPPDWNPFYAGFGNRDTDEVSYREVGVPLARTFTINPKGHIQKACSAVQSSTWSSLSAINELVHELFPPLPATAVRMAALAARMVAHGSDPDIAPGEAVSGGSGRLEEALQYAALAGIVCEDTTRAAAAAAADQRRRSSCGGGGTASSSKLATGGSVGAATMVVDATGTRHAAAAPVDEALVSESGVTVVKGSDVTGMQLELVGPAREEFADLQYWRPSLELDISAELLALAQSQPRPAQAAAMSPTSGAAAVLAEGSHHGASGAVRQTSLGIAGKQPEPQVQAAPQHSVSGQQP